LLYLRARSAKDSNLFNAAYSSSCCLSYFRRASFRSRSEPSSTVTSIGSMISDEGASTSSTTEFSTLASIEKFD